MVTPYKKLTRKFNGKVYRFSSYHESKKALDRYIEGIDMPNFKLVFNYRITKPNKGYVLWIRQK